MHKRSSGRSSMAQLHQMDGYSHARPDLGLTSEGSDCSSQGPLASSHSPCESIISPSLQEEDVEMKSNRSSGSGTETHSNESHGNDRHGNESHGESMTGSSNSNSKDSALLWSSESNKDIFAVAVSLITERIVYISDQAASILNCKRDVFKSAKLVEFLAPQDVSVFYSFTTPYRLPSWSMCSGAESSPPDCMQEKSFFCRISGSKVCDGDRHYYPFRMTPYST